MRRLSALLGFVFVVVVALVYSSSLLFSHPSHMAAADSHYHFAMSREIWAGTIAPDVAKGLPWTILADMPVDHYWGYHLLVAPFAACASPVTGMKAAACTLFALVFASIYLFLHARKVPFAWAWALLPAMFSTQDWRYLQLRGGQLLVPLLFLMLHVAFFAAPTRTAARRAGLVAIAYVGMLSYHGAVLLLPMHIAGACAYFAWEHARGRRSYARAIEPAFTAAGLALGLTLNPYMDTRASTWRFAAFHVRNMGSDSAGLYDDLELSEFHGFPLSIVLGHAEWALLLVAVLVAAAWVTWRVASRRDVDLDLAVVAAVAVLGIAITARAMRVREYSVPLGFVLLALLSRPKRRLPPIPSFGVTVLAAALIPFGLVNHWRARGWRSTFTSRRINSRARRASWTRTDRVRF